MNYKKLNWKRDLPKTSYGLLLHFDKEIYHRLLNYKKLNWKRDLPKTSYRQLERRKDRLTWALTRAWRRWNAAAKQLTIIEQCLNDINDKLLDAKGHQNVKIN